MKLEIEKRELMAGIGIVSKAVSSGGNMPILNCVLIGAQEEGLQLTGTNLELAIRTSYIDAGVQTHGRIALDARLFSDIVKRLPDERVRITVDDRFHTTIKCGKSVFNICGSNPEEYPVMPEVERESRFTVDGSVLRDMIRQTLFAVSEDKSKPILSGELVMIDDGVINIVSCDTYRIAYRYGEIGLSDGSVEVIVPGKSMGEVAKLLSGRRDDGDVTVYFTDKHILFELEDCTVVSLLIDGEFIKFRDPLDAEYSLLTVVSRVELLSCLERACLVAFDGDRKIPVKFRIGDNAITITSNAEKGAIYEEISAEIEGDGLELAFNPNLIIDVLKVIDDEHVAIQYNGALAPCIIRPVEEGNYKYLVLPLRLK